MPVAPPKHKHAVAAPVRKHEAYKRESSTKRGYDRKWRKARAWYLKQNPWCVRCLANHLRTVATVVDHIIPHRGDKYLFWLITNWQALCKRCHDIKTATEDGGFGRAVDHE